VTASSVPQPGTTVGPYRLGRRLGVGGMGEVFEAHDPVLDRRVALKLIAPALAGDPGFRARFVREARVQASLDSPHVVHVYGHGEDDGRLWLASQLIPDGDLGALLRAYGALPPRTALDLVAQVADGLADAHAAGLVHRDLKPSNVLLRRRPDGVTAYLADFGVARRVDAAASDGGLVGTPAYQAPELRAGEPATVASDVYALGCVLRVALGARPPSGVARIVRRATAARPQDRHPSAAVLRDDLRAAARGGRRAPLVVAAVLALAAGGAGGLWMPGPVEGRPPAASAGSATTALPDVDAAAASLAHALAARGVLQEARADCAARRWIRAVGLPAMVAAGLFDADLDYVDRPSRELTPALRAAALTAVATCRRQGPTTRPQVGG
jgi:serine/threonine-protein kinase